MEKKHTAVDWMFIELELNPLIDKNQWLEYGRKLQREQLEDAFRSGWMRANALNYEDSYFEYYIKGL